MAQLMDYAHYLTKEIGPRPAGTEEEQQAALYITDQFQREAGFAATMEEFSNNANPELTGAILAGVVIVVTVLAIIFPALSIFAFVLAVAAAALYALEELNRPVLSRVLPKGASQNVVAKYQPNPDEEASGRARSRKLILIAHYDTGRVKPALVERAEATNLPLPLICLIGMGAAAFFLLLRIFIAASGGGALIVLNVLSILALLVCLLPVVKLILMRTSPYNEGANNNATGTAALIEVARRISRGSVSEAELATGDEDVVIHGEDAARSAGLIPEGAQIRYEAEHIVPPAELGEYDEEERLLAAKAAIAALTGKPVERHVYGSVADKLVNSRAHETDAEQAGQAAEGPEPMQPLPDVDREDGLNTPVQAASQPAAAQPAVPETTLADGFKNAPSWFLAAQKNARRSDLESEGEIHRSRYTEAMEHAQRERAQREQEALQAEQQHQEEERLKREAEARSVLEQRMGAPVAPEGNALADSAEDELLTEASAAQAAPAAEHAPAAELPAYDFSEPRKRDASQVLGDLQDAAFEEAPSRSFDMASSQTDANALFDEPAAGAGADQQPAVNPDQTQAFPGYAQLDAAVAAAAEANDSVRKHEAFDPAEIEPVPRRFISLPELDVSQPPRGQVSGLPTIDAEQPGGADAGTAQDAQAERSDRLRNLRATVPSLSGVIRTKNEARKATAASLPNVVNVPSLSTATPEAEPEAPQRIKVSEPAGDVDYNMEVSTEGSFDFDNPAVSSDDSYEGYSDAFDDEYADGFEEEAYDPSQVDMPSSRAGGFFSRFRRKGSDELEETPQEWLNIDDDFDARSVGRARGSWESFRDESKEFDAERADERAEADAPRRRNWEGGAYSRMSLGHVNMRSGEEAEADEMIPDEPPEAEIGRSLTGEIEQIYHFRNPNFNTEIWFVAIGSDNASRDGVKAFLEEHRDELRGSMAIEVESLGAGTLSVASQEGRIRKVNASSRIKRITRSAVTKTGIALDDVSLAGTDSIASELQRAGFQAMHLFGAEGGRPALKGSADDVLENVDEMLLDEHVNFLYELLKYR